MWNTALWILNCISLHSVIKNKLRQYSSSTRISRTVRSSCYSYSLDVLLRSCPDVKVITMIKQAFYRALTDFTLQANYISVIQIVNSTIITLPNDLRVLYKTIFPYYLYEKCNEHAKKKHNMTILKIDQYLPGFRNSTTRIAENCLILKTVQNMQNILQKSSSAVQPHI